jgi:hypothetical protein
VGWDIRAREKYSGLLMVFIYLLKAISRAGCRVITFHQCLFVKGYNPTCLWECGDWNLINFADFKK